MISHLKYHGWTIDNRPLFNKYKIRGIKALDYIDFCEVAKLINEKTHLTEQGLEKIILIKSKMNKARYFN